MTDKTVKALYLDKAYWGPGGTRMYWVAWYEGEEESETPQRGYGQTKREAVRSLELGNP
jgi:hypothetical protein